MTQFGFTLSSEEFGPTRLVDLARSAEENGFDFISISDHFHPWVRAQGHAPFVWSVLGGISQVTSSIRVGVGVTCPTVRMHPAIVAHAVATTSLMFPDRFFWGVGSGEALNEQILGDPWPPADVRLEMMEEAVGLIREMWKGESTTHRGDYYLVEDATLFDAPADDVPIVVSAFGTTAAKVAARIGDGLWTVGTGGEPVEVFRQEGGQGPVYGQLHVCWAESREKAVETAHRQWPNSGVPGQLSQDLRTPKHFEMATQIVTPEMIAESIPCGPDPEPLLESIDQAIEGGVDNLYFHQIGDDQEGFFRFWREELKPELDKRR